MQMHLITEMREVGDEIKGFDEELREVEVEIRNFTFIYSKYPT